MSVTAPETESNANILAADAPLPTFWGKIKKMFNLQFIDDHGQGIIMISY